MTNKYSFVSELTLNVLSDAGVSASEACPGQISWWIFLGMYKIALHISIFTIIAKQFWKFVFYYSEWEVVLFISLKLFCQSFEVFRSKYLREKKNQIIT